MLYAIISTDRPDSLALRRQTRPAHLERLRELQTQGRLVIAGPHPNVDSDDPGEAGFSGSLIVAEFDNLHTAEQWANQDPYLLAGIYETVIVKPFKRVFPE